MSPQRTDDMDGEPLDIIFRADWSVPRHGTVTEFRRFDDELRYRVEIWDEGRSPFLVRWFNDPTSAADFVDKLSNA